MSSLLHVSKPSPGVCLHIQCFGLNISSWLVAFTSYNHYFISKYSGCRTGPWRGNIAGCRKCRPLTADEIVYIHFWYIQSPDLAGAVRA